LTTRRESVSSPCSPMIAVCQTPLVQAPRITIRPSPQRPPRRSTHEHPLPAAL
jgi:hypothetical protein